MAVSDLSGSFDLHTGPCGLELESNMPVRFAEVVARVEAAKPISIEQTVREAIAALGHEVAPTGEVYNPAEGSYREPARTIRASGWSMPPQQNVHWRGGRRGR